MGIVNPSDSPLTDDDVAWVRSYFIDFVRANGPLPTMRIGRQPYGVLPVTSLNAWKPPTGQENQLKRDSHQVTAIVTPTRKGVAGNGDALLLSRR